MRVVNWRSGAVNRDRWREIVNQIKAHLGLNLMKNIKVNDSLIKKRDILIKLPTILKFCGLWFFGSRAYTYVNPGTHIPCHINQKFKIKTWNFRCVRVSTHYNICYHSKI